MTVVINFHCYKTAIRDGFQLLLGIGFDFYKNSLIDSPLGKFANKLNFGKYTFLRGSLFLSKQASTSSLP